MPRLSREDLQARLEAIREASTLQYLQAGDAHREVLNLTDGLWQLLLGEEAPQSRFRAIAGRATAQSATRHLPLARALEETA